MFMSSDQRFIVKTMSRWECHVLLDILPAYRVCVVVMLCAATLCGGLLRC